MKKRTAVELTCIFILLLLSAAGIIANRTIKSGSIAVITLDGKEVYRRSLSDKGTFSVPEINGMTFEISDKGIMVTDSDCPDKICVKTGIVSDSTGSAVCMPKKVIVTVEE